jgi:dipeptidyl aminopeptidase/acylaminoacyl peptidase
MSPTIKLLCALACGMACQMAGAAHGTTKPHASVPPLELLFAERARFAERLSPDGNQIAFLAPDADGAIQLCKITTEVPETPLTVSLAQGSPVSSFFWIGNDRLLWQTFDQGRARLFLTHLANLTHTEILSREKRSIRLEGVVDSASPSILVGLSDGPSAFPDLYRVSLDGPSEPQLVCKNQHQIVTWGWDQMGTPVAGLRWKEDGAKEILNLKAAGHPVIFRADPSDDARLLSATNDGLRVLVLTNHGSDLTGLYGVEINTGKREQIARDHEAHVDLDQILLDSKADKVVAVSFADDSTRWQSFSPTFSQMLEAANLTSDTRNLHVSSTDAQQRRFLLTRASSREPGETYLYDSRSGTMCLLWRECPEWNRETFCESKSSPYAARDGCPIPAYLTTPREGSTPWPLVVFPHGGPRTRTHADFDPRVQFLTSRGYAVLQPNFRGSRGYGKAFMNAGNGQWGRGVMQTDVTDGVEHLIRAGFADKQRVAIMGGSYGGYAALAGLTFTPDHYAAAISIFGISDLPAYAAHSPVEWQAYAGDTVRLLGTSSCETSQTLLHDRSPVYHAHAATAPLLIYHGAKDHLIPSSHSRRMAHAMMESAKPVEYLLAPNESHGFSRPESEMALYHAIELFLHQHLGGKLGPPPSSEVSQILQEFRQSGIADAKP